MKRKRPEDRSEVWRPRRSVKLYLDDLDEIFAIVRGLGGNLSAETDEFLDVREANDLAALDVHGVRSVLIRSDDGHRSINVVLGATQEGRDDGVAVTISARDDNDLVGASRRIQEILERRQTRFGALGGGMEPHQLWLPVLSVLMPLFAVVATLSTALNRDVDVKGEEVPWPRFGVVLAVTATGLLAWSMFGRNARPGATILPRWKAEAPTFWEKNRLNILISLATNVVVAVLSFVAGRALS